MKKYNSPEIKVAHLHGQTILAGSITVSTTPEDPGSALIKEDNIFDSDIEY